MGSNLSTNRRLSSNQTRDDKKGLLYKTIGDIWDQVPDHFAGEYEKAKGLRENSLPSTFEIIRLKLENRLANKRADAVSNDNTSGISRGDEEAEAILASFQQRSTVADASKRATEATTHAERLSNERGLLLGLEAISRAHLLPKDKQYKDFWGKIAELLIGRTDYDLDGSDYEFLTDQITTMFSNRLIFDREHNHMFDTLSQGVLLAIPILSRGAIAGWKTRQPYEILVVCDSPNTYQAFAQDTEYPQAKWAKETDLDIATDAMSSSAKILADSLCQHWVSHLAKQGGNSWHADKNRKMLRKLKEKLERDGRRVAVPKKVGAEKIAKCRLNPHKPGRNKRLKLLKIDLGMIYKGDLSQWMPDPMLLSLKAAINWSGYCNDRKLKLLPACADPNSSADEEELVGLDGFIMTRDQADAEIAAQESTKIQSEFMDQVLRYVSDDDDGNSSVSTLGDE